MAASKRNFLLLFDIDGTLVHMAKGMPHTLFQDMVEEVYRTRVDLAGYSFTGKTDLNILREVATLVGIGPEVMMNREQDAIHWVSKSLKPRINDESLELLPNVRELLEAVKPRSDTTLALLTGNLPDCASAKLDQFDLMKYFEFGVYGIESVDRNDLAAIALKRVKELHPDTVYDPRDVVIVGDSERDVLCAQSIGARCVITLTGYSTRQEVEALHPDVVLESFADLDKTIDAIYGNV